MQIEFRYRRHKYVNLITVSPETVCWFMFLSDQNRGVTPELNLLTLFQHKSVTSELAEQLEHMEVLVELHHSDAH